MTQLLKEEVSAIVTPAGVEPLPRPRFLVHEVRVAKVMPWQSDPSPSERYADEWHAAATDRDVASIVDRAEPCGAGTCYESVSFEVYRVDAVSPVKSVATRPRTHADCVLPFENGKVVVGVGPNPKVMTSEEGFDFAVAFPPAGETYDDRTVSEQGVVLFAVHKTGEVRWVVNRDDARAGRQDEAIRHWGLTWKAEAVEAV